MARNVEIKARIISFPGVLQAAETLATEPIARFTQDDTFYCCPNGRLKLRRFAQGHAELIFYRRSDQAGPKTSFYDIARIDKPDELHCVLNNAYGVRGQVIKHRTLVMAGRTRIHLDKVEGLGEFIELEVVLKDGEPAEEGMEEAHLLMNKLGVSSDQLVEHAYIDLLDADAQ